MMFEPLPDPERGGVVWYSDDVVTEATARGAIVEATRRFDHATARFHQLERDATKAQLASSWHFYASEDDWLAAQLARIHAILLTAVHLEGAVNAWGVLIAGEKFFQQHIERCRLESKIALCVALLGKGQIPSNHETLKLLHRLMERRNQLAHRKTKETSIHKTLTFEWPPHWRPDLDLCTGALDSFAALVVQLSPANARIIGDYSN